MKLTSPFAACLWIVIATIYISCSPSPKNPEGTLPSKEGKIPATVPLRFSLDKIFHVGEDNGTPLDFNTFDAPVKFNGELEKVTVAFK
jgi:hypothetical protein